ncbi:MAG TPA: tyrosine--tRNA ligase, partial [Chitinophagaceae bacterium]|nr:tyrosine--tRNA ligase [Chitinophagaceae bacterium]
LHIGSLVPILLLVHLQKAGHKPIALVGGATGMVGDPSGKSEERNLLDEATLNLNLQGIRRQLEKYLVFDQAIPNGAEMVNNFDWFREIRFLDFIRDVGKHITVNYMMAKDSVRKRLEGFTGMSFTEFSYQLVQGYDFYWLYKNRNCKLQMGGSDQWGNITTGTELIRRKAGGEAFAFTCPLLTRSDGGKFGKTEKGNIWLDPAKTSPYQFYQFWLNAADADAERWVKIFTFLSKEEIHALHEAHQKNPALRLLQKTLAREVTIFIHGQEEFEQARVTTEKLFNQTGAVENLSEQDLHAMEGIVKSTYAIAELQQGVDVVRFLAETGILPSRGEARKLVQNGGISINRNKVENIQFHISTKLLLHKKYILVQRGKKNFYLVEAK